MKNPFTPGNGIELAYLAGRKDYLKKLRKRDESLNEGWGQIVTPLSYSR